MIKALHFKNTEGFRKYAAYGHIHHVFKEKAPYPKVFIGGKLHSVKHDRGEK